MRIVIVDDHPLFLDGLRHVLQALDPDVVATQVTDVQAAIDYIMSHSDIDLILLDINMPGLDGFDLLSTLVAHERWIPAVIVSALDNPQIVLQALDAGALGFIPKSLSAAEILSALKRVLNGEIFLPEETKHQIDQLRRTLAGKKQDFGISAKQIRVLELLAKGYSNRKIALALNLSEHTVKSHLKTLFVALNADNRTDCVQKAVKLGLVRMSDVGAGQTDD